MINKTVPSTPKLMIFTKGFIFIKSKNNIFNIVNDMINIPVFIICLMFLNVPASVIIPAYISQIILNDASITSLISNRVNKYMVSSEIIQIPVISAEYR